MKPVFKFAGAARGADKFDAGFASRGKKIFTACHTKSTITFMLRAALFRGAFAVVLIVSLIASWNADDAGGRVRPHNLRLTPAGLTMLIVHRVMRFLHNAPGAALL